MKVVYGKSMVEGAPFGNKNAAGSRGRSSSVHVSRMASIRTQAGFTRGNSTQNYFTDGKKPLAHLTKSSERRVWRATAGLKPERISISKSGRSVDIKRSGKIGGKQVERTRFYSNVSKASQGRVKNQLARSLFKSGGTLA